MSNANIHGNLDDIGNGIHNLTKAMEDANGHHDFELGDLFNDDFMKKYTKYSKIEDFVKASKITVDEIQNYGTGNSKIDSKLDKVAQDYARFATFNDFIGQAVIDKSLKDHNVDFN